jgi:hypothetical protein
MKYFVPDIDVPRCETPERRGLGGLNADVVPERRGLAGLIRSFAPSSHSGGASPARERLGGAPFGLPAHLWPKCRACGRSQSLLAQLAHDDNRLDLGRRGRVLFVFQCAHQPGTCATWEAFSGANACFVVEPEELGDSYTAQPRDHPPADHEVVVRGWVEREDALSPASAHMFLSAATFFSLTEETASLPTSSTRLGGVPRWRQSPDGLPRPDWRFVGQLASAYSFLSRPTGPADWVRRDPEAREGRTWVAPGPNFGGGIAYLFLKDADGPPDGCMFWQR